MTTAITTREVPMLTLSATDVAIALAHEAGTLIVKEFTTRFGETWIKVADEHGTIEVHPSWDDYHSRFDAIMERVKQ